MKPRYISKAERNQIITLDALAGTLMEKVVPMSDKLGKEVSYRMKTAATHLVKGLSAYLASLAPEDEAKVRHESRTSRIILASQAYVPKQETDEGMQTMWDLAAFAIGKECRGCTKDGNTCELKHLLVRADVPYSSEEQENCPYELPAEVQ